MKKILSVILVLVMCLPLCACGANADEVKEELRGRWSYDFYAAAVGEHCHKIFEFKGDGTYESAWINDESPSKSTYENGTYSIKGKKIVLTPSDGSDASFIEYSYNNGNLKLFDGESELKKH